MRERALAPLGALVRSVLYDGDMQIRTVLFSFALLATMAGCGAADPGSELGTTTSALSVSVDDTVTSEPEVPPEADPEAPPEDDLMNVGNGENCYGIYQGCMTACRGNRGSPCGYCRDSFADCRARNPRPTGLE